MPFPFKDDALRRLPRRAGHPAAPQTQYFDGYRLTPGGVTLLDNGRIERRLGFSDVQQFPASTTAARATATRSVSGEDCDR